MHQQYQLNKKVCSEDKKNSRKIYILIAEPNNSTQGLEGKVEKLFQKEKEKDYKDRKQESKDAKTGHQYKRSNI